MRSPAARAAGIPPGPSAWLPPPTHQRPDHVRQDLVHGQIAVDGSITKAPGGRCFRSRGRRNTPAQGRRWITRSGRTGSRRVVFRPVPTGTTPPLTAPALEHLDGLGPLPDEVTVHLDAGHDSDKTRTMPDERDLHGRIAPHHHGPARGRSHPVAAEAGPACRSALRRSRGPVQRRPSRPTPSRRHHGVTGHLCIALICGIKASGVKGRDSHRTRHGRQAGKRIRLPSREGGETATRSSASHPATELETGSRLAFHLARKRKHPVLRAVRTGAVT